MNSIKFCYDGENGVRVDSVLSEHLNMTRSAVERLCDSGNVCINGVCIKKSARVNFGDEISADIPDPEPEQAIPQDIPLDIVYEDSDLIIVNKPKSMVVHPAPGHYDGTLVNALLYHCGSELSGIGGVRRPGIVHRIDKDTSGLLMVAKNDFTHIGLAQQIKDHSFIREYKTVVIGHPKQDNATINLPIGRHPVDRKKMTVTDKNSKSAVTHYSTEKELNGFTVLKIKLETGRTHQIRVHMSYIGHPVAGDPLYGGLQRGTEELCGQCLHAKKLGFVHPRTQKHMLFDSELPEYFVNFVRKYEF